jgi:hypothetical protein
VAKRGKKPPKIGFKRYPPGRIGMSEEIVRYVEVPKPIQFYMRRNGEKIYDRLSFEFSTFVLERLFQNPLWGQGGPGRNRLARSIEDAFDNASNEGHGWKLTRPRKTRCSHEGCEQDGDVLYIGGQPLCFLEPSGGHATEAVIRTGRKPDLEVWTRGPRTPHIVIKDSAHKLLVQCVEKPVSPRIDETGRQSSVEGYGLPPNALGQLVSFEDAILNAQTNPPIDEVEANGVVQHAEAEAPTQAAS